MVLSLSSCHRCDRRNNRAEKCSMNPYWPYWHYISTLAVSSGPIPRTVATPKPSHSSQCGYLDIWAVILFRLEPWALSRAPQSHISTIYIYRYLDNLHAEHGPFSVLIVSAYQDKDVRRCLGSRPVTDVWRGLGLSYSHLNTSNNEFWTSNLIEE